MRLIVGMTGAVGSVYGLRLLETVRRVGGVETHLMTSRGVCTSIGLETGRAIKDVGMLADVVHDPDDRDAAVTTGSLGADAMIVLPCCISTLAVLRAGDRERPMGRAAGAVLEARRPLVLGVRELAASSAAQTRVSRPLVTVGELRARWRMPSSSAVGSGAGRSKWASGAPLPRSRSVSSPDAVIAQLRATLRDDETLAERLGRSLVQARQRAEAELDTDLFEALEWPQDLEQYEAYLARFVRWIPQQSDAKAWQGQSPQGRTAKEVSDRLAHFFFLVDQDVDQDATAIMENSEQFRDWLTGFARQWGSFLDAPDSFSDEILDSFLRNSPEYTVEESLVDGRPNMPSGWRTFNQFFARELNAGLRPVAEPGTNTVIASPADCYYQRWFDVDDASNIPATRIKNQRYGNVEQLLEGSRYAATFAGGTFVHYMLPPSSYHRFHVPVSGRVEEAFVNHGKVFMQVDLADGQLQSRDAASTGYEFSQTRGVLTIDTAGSEAGDVGVVGVVPVGMSHVASVVLTATEGHPVAKGDEFGYFQFGGSDIILLFQPGIDPRIDTSEGFRHVGTSVARCRDRTA